MIPPANFIPIAEESGQIVAIGAWALREACRQNKAWQDAGLPRVPVAVNISALQFQNRQFHATLEQALRDSGLDPRFLELELNESALTREAESKLEMLRGIREMGVRLVIDDFGTGYSSLSCLKRFPIDKLKIDQSFVRDVIIDPENAAIVTAIINMAHSLRLKTIAEGVETQEQYERLKTLNCDELQGYFFSRPLPAEECAALLAESSEAVGT
jgi:EAL domain-containing protein (putative c-di-GMP-specific phosphodiesterase class I)